LHFGEAVTRFHFERVFFEADDCAADFGAVFELDFIGASGSCGEHERRNAGSNADCRTSRWIPPSHTLSIAPARMRAKFL
jgi:hypothetical protein